MKTIGLLLRPGRRWVLGGALILWALPLGAAGESADGLPPVVVRYEELLLRSPEPGTAFDKVCEHFQQHGGLEALAARWQKAAKKASPEDAATYWMLGGLLAERRGDGEAAGKAYARAAQARPQDYRAWVLLGDYRISKGELEPATEALEHALAVETPPAVRLDLYRKLATTYQRLLQSDKALAVWQRMTAEFPEDPDALEEVGLAQLDAGQLDAARATFEKLRGLVGGDAYRKVRVVMHLAAIDEDQDRTAEAIARYESLLAETSEASWMHREVRRLIEDIYRRQDDLPGLVAYYQRRLKDKPGDVQASAQLADVLFELNRRDEALAALREAVKAAPDQTDLRLRLAERLLQNNRPDEAATIYRHLAENQPGEVAYWEMLGNAQWAKFTAGGKDADRQAALASWRRTAEGKDAPTSMILRLAEILASHDLADEAAAQWERALAREPGNNDIREHLARHLADHQQKEKAAKVLEAMVAGPLATPENYLRLARLRRADGSTDAALEATAAGLKLAPDHFELLSMHWALLADAGKWEESAALFDRLRRAAPNDYFIGEIENRHLSNLQRQGKLDALRDSLAARLDGKPPLDAADLRLLARAALHTHAQELAQRVFADGAKRFPNNPDLLRLEAESLRRQSDYAGRAAILNRLLAIQPDRRAQWLTDLAQNWAEARQWDPALAAANELLAYAPASPDSYTLAADILFSAGRTDEAVQRLREAIKFSQRPNTLRLRLARHYQDAGDLDTAIAIMEEAFEQEKDASARLALMKPLTEAYFQAGRVDELIESFQRRQRAEAGGWRYALYLAAIYTQMQDFTAARKQLSRAVADRTRDADLLRQLLRLAEAEGNVAEQLRYQSQLTRLEPSVANRLALMRTELANGDTAQALALARENREQLLERPAVLRELVNESGDADFAASLAEIFSESLRARTGDWAGRLALAEFYLADGNLEGAEEVYWEVLEMAPPQESIAQADANAAEALAELDPESAPATASSTPGLAQRLAWVRQLRRGAVGRVFGQTTPNPGVQGAVSGGWANSFDNARDMALLHLGLLALEGGHAEDFLARLRRFWADHQTSRRERILHLAILESRDALFGEIEDYTRSGERDTEMDAFCAMFLRGTAVDTIPPGRMAAMLHTLYDRLVEASPQQRMRLRSQEISLLDRIGRGEEANQLTEDILAHFDSTNRSELVDAFGLACRTGRLDDAQRFYDTINKLPEDGPHRYQGVYLAFQLHRLAIEQEDDRRLRDLTGELIDAIAAQDPAELGPRVVRPASGPWSRRRLRVNPLPTMRHQQEMPGPNEYVGPLQFQWLKSASEIMKSHDQQDMLVDLLHRREQHGPAESRIFALVADAYVQWWEGRQQEAIALIAKARSRDDTPGLRLTEAAMLVQTRQSAKARKLIDNLSESDDPDAYIDGQFLLLQDARYDRDTERAEAIGTHLLAMPLSPAARRALTNELRQFGLVQLMRQAADSDPALAAANPQRPARRLQDQLEELSRSGDSKRLASVARRVLADDPLRADRSGLAHLRRTALRSLEQAGVLDEYREEIAEELRRSPNSTRFHLLLAEAWRDDDPARAADSLRKVAALRPRDLSLQRELAQALLAAGRPGDAADVYDKLLQQEPVETLLRDHHHIVRAFGDVDRLGDLTHRLETLRLPADMPLRGRSPLAGAFMQIGKALERERHWDEAVTVWELAAQHSSYTDLNIIRMLTEALFEQGRVQEVTAHIERALFPEEAKDPPLFSLNANPDMGRAQIFNVSIQDREVTAPVLSLIEHAEQAGGLPRLMARAREALANSTDDDREDNRALLTLLRIEARDPGLLTEDKSWLENPPIPGGNRHLRGNYVRLLADRLEQWPAAAPLALRLLQASRTDIDDNRENYSQRLELREDIVELALTLGEEDAARQALRESGEILAEQAASSSRGFSADHALTAARRMLALDMIPEATALAKVMREAEAVQVNVGFQRQFAQFEEELRLVQGRISDPQCIAWLARSDGDGNVTIAYEIGADRSDGHQPSNPRVIVSGRDYPKLDGRFDVELVFGTSAENMRRLALLKACPTRGTWTGHLPAASGYVRALMRDRQDRDARHIGLVLPVVSSPNLLANPLLQGTGAEEPRDGWASVPPVLAKVFPGGPTPGGRFVRLRPADSDQNEYISDPITLAPGRSYFQSAWLRVDRSAGQQYARVGRRYLDAAGRVLRQTWCPARDDGVGDRWQWYGQELRGDGDNRPGSELIPDGAVALQVVLNVRGGCDLHGLYLARLDDPDTETNSALSIDKPVDTR